MIKKILFVLSFQYLITIVYCQDRHAGLFYIDLSALNPAYVGMLEANQAIFYNIYEYNNKDYNFSRYTGRTALNIPITKIHSGIGVHSSYVKNGPISDLDFGFVYSFKYEITDKINISIGSNFSVYRIKIKGDIVTSYNGSFYTNSDYINENFYLFNMDIGLWLKVYGFQIGLSNKHINEAIKEVYLLNDTIPFRLKLNSNINAVLNYDLPIGQNHTLSNSLLIYNLKDFSKSKYFVISNQFALNNKFIFGLTTEIYNLNEIQCYLIPNLGVNLSDRFKFLLSINLVKINSDHPKENTIEAVLNYNF